MKCTPAAIVLALGIIAAYVRLYLAVDVTDESQYIAQTVLPIIGGKIFVNDLLIQQGAQYIILPLCGLYTAIFGFEGIALLIRHIYFAFAMGSVIMWYHLLKEYFSKIELGFVLSTMILFIPFGINTWSYNTFSQIALPLSLLMFFDNRPGRSRYWVWISALLGTLACYAYPTLVVVLLFAIVNAISSRQYRWSHIAHYVGSGAVFGFFILGSLLFVGWNTLKHALEFTGQFGEAGGREKFYAMFQQILEAPQWYHFVGISLVVLLLIYDRWLTFYKTTVVLVGALLISFAFKNLLHAYNFPYDHVLHSWLFYATILILIVRTTWSNRSILPQLPLPLTLLARCSILTGITYGYSSGNGIVNCAIGFLPAFIIYLLQIFKGFQLFAPTYFTRIWCVGMSVVIMVGFIYGTYRFTYRDPIWNTPLTKVSVGPFKNIYTTPYRAAMLEQLEADILEVAKTRNTIFAAYMTSAYFITKLRPITSMLGIHPVAWPPDRVAQILEHTLKGGEFPEIVVTGKHFIGGYPLQFENFFFSTGKYIVTYNRPEYRILTLLPSAQK